MKAKRDSVLLHEVKRDIATFRRLDGKRRIKFIWDYYKWKILAAVTVLVIVCTFAGILWQGQRPCRLWVCAVLNTDQSCRGWFQDFGRDLSADGKRGALDLDEDQPFDYDNLYYYVQEIEVQTKVASQRIDVAIGGPDLYDYLLAIKACAPLDSSLPADLADSLMQQGLLVKSTAGITINPDGTPDTAGAVDGYFAADISDTAFGRQYNTQQQTEEGEPSAPLYAIIISNTDHMEDAITLLRSLCTQ